MRARLMGVDENYDNDIEKHNTHPDMLPPESQECATIVSEETKKMLAKAGAFRKVMEFTQAGPPNATRKTQVILKTEYTSRSVTAIITGVCYHCFRGN